MKNPAPTSLTHEVVCTPPGLFGLTRKGSRTPGLVAASSDELVTHSRKPPPILTVQDTRLWGLGSNGERVPHFPFSVIRSSIRLRPPVQITRYFPFGITSTKAGPWTRTGRDRVLHGPRLGDQFLQADTSVTGADAPHLVQFQIGIADQQFDDVRLGLAAETPMPRSPRPGTMLSERP